ncbi:hypothetical protein, partial [Paracoccus pantotrophus]|uniref:hypothetical protein n=1 Tax=Paracoccus pantotrophus TaxID=82367 RepID=UPI003F68ABC4
GIVVGLPVHRAVAGRLRLAHTRPLAHWIRSVNPSENGVLQQRRLEAMKNEIHSHMRRGLDKTKAFVESLDEQRRQTSPNGRTK